MITTEGNLIPGLSSTLFRNKATLNHFLNYSMMKKIISTRVVCEWATCTALFFNFFDARLVSNERSEKSEHISNDATKENTQKMYLHAKFFIAPNMSEGLNHCEKILVFMIHEMKSYWNLQNSFFP